jgi:hypothetical protein
MRAFLIPTNSSKSVREISFVHDESWRYVVTTYDDPDRVPWIFSQVLTRRTAHVTTS